MNSDRLLIFSMDLSVQYKCILIGDSQVGKTVLFQTITTGNFLDPENPTTNPTVTPSTQQMGITTSNGDSINIYFWDTAGSEQYQSMAPLYYRDSDFALVCFTSNAMSTAPKWIAQIRSITPDCRLILVVTKADLIKPERLEQVEAQLLQMEQDFACLGHQITSDRKSVV